MTMIRSHSSPALSRAVHGRKPRTNHVMVPIEDGKNHERRLRSKSASLSAAHELTEEDIKFLGGEVQTMELVKTLKTPTAIESGADLDTNVDGVPTTRVHASSFSSTGSYSLSTSTISSKSSNSPCTNQRQISAPCEKTVPRAASDNLPGSKRDGRQETSKPELSEDAPMTPPTLSNPVHSQRRSIFHQQRSPRSPNDDGRPLPTKSMMRPPCLLPENETNVQLSPTQRLTTRIFSSAENLAAESNSATTLTSREERTCDPSAKLVSTVSPSTKALDQRRRKKYSNRLSSGRRSIFGNSSPDLPSYRDTDMDENGLESLFLPRVEEAEFSRIESFERSFSLPTLPSESKRLPSPTKPSLKRSSVAKRQDRNVSFSTLEIREYAVSLGDNPCCSTGPPISLGWEYRNLGEVPLEEYEQIRAFRNPRRALPDMLMSYTSRHYLLLRTGYTPNQLREAIEEVNRIKHERGFTEFFMLANRVDEVVRDIVESIKKQLKKMTT